MKKLNVECRWCIRKDLPEVQEIENLSFEHPWTEEDFIDCARQSNVILRVAENNRRIFGFIVYAMYRKHFEILNLAVHPLYRLNYVGEALVERLVRSLHPQKRTRIVANVRETNLDAHLFFRACEFRAVKVLRRFEINGEDAYRFQFHVRQLQQVAT